MRRLLADGNGKRWAFMERFNIPDRNGKVYLSRLRLVQTPIGSIYLHRIASPDQDRHMHDHPWSFVSIILWGGYSEEWRKNGFAPSYYASRMRTWRPFTAHRMRLGEFHSIRNIFRAPTWTLLFVGPRRSEWGFLTENGWVPWRVYRGREDERRAQRAMVLNGRARR